MRSALKQKSRCGEFLLNKNVFSKSTQLGLAVEVQPTAYSIAYSRVSVRGTVQVWTSANSRRRRHTAVTS